MSKWNRLVATLIAIAAVAALPMAVLAAPAPFEGIPVTCPGRGETVLTAPGQGAFTPGFFLDENALLVPHRTAYTISTDAGSTSEAAFKSAPLPAEAITCTFDATFNFGGIRYRLEGWVIGVVRGQQ